MKKAGLLISLMLISLSYTNAAVNPNHPRHEVRVWTTRFEGTIFRVIKFPHCQHVETIPTNNPPGETVQQAKRRLGGFAASTACFYNTETLLPVDYFRRNGRVTVGREVGRRVLLIRNDSLVIASNCDVLDKNPQFDAVALGSLIKPWSLDGFSLDFAVSKTDRMALAISRKYNYIIQSKTDLPKMGRFVSEVLSCDSAINTDGGHSVKGSSPFHLVFRWRPG